MSKRILVVESRRQSPDHSRYAGPYRLRITEAETGEEALAAIAKQRPDLILMDIQLPTMGGTATSRITAGEDSPFPTIVARSIAAVHESAFRTKRTFRQAQPMSAFGGRHQCLAE